MRIRVDGVVEPYVARGGGATGQAQVQREAGERHRAGGLHHAIRRQRRAGIEDRQFGFEGRALAGVVAGLAQHLLQLPAIVGEEAAHRAFDRVAGMDPRLGIGRAHARVAADMIEVPVRVDDRGHRLPAFQREIQQRLRVRGMAPGIDHDQSLRGHQHHRVAVGLASGLEVAAQQEGMRRDRQRFRRRERAAQAQAGGDNEDSDHGATPAAGLRPCTNSAPGVPRAVTKGMVGPLSRKRGNGGAGATRRAATLAHRPSTAEIAMA